ncbi:MAG: hypothetical protein ACXWC6_05020 [Ramlibacter sp.]
MPTDAGSLLAILVCFAITFVAARLLGRAWRSRRRERAEQAARAEETRQVRRARERSQRR